MKSTSEMFIKIYHIDTILLPVLIHHDPLLPPNSISFFFDVAIVVFLLDAFFFASIVISTLFTMHFCAWVTHVQALVCSVSSKKYSQVFVLECKFKLNLCLHF